MIELIQSSTIHGVSRIENAKGKLSKFLWSVLFIFGIIGIIVNIVFVTIKYFSYPILISYTFEHEPFKWPDITFCNPTAPYYFNRNNKPYKYWQEISNKSKGIVKMLANETELFRIIQNRKTNDLELIERTITMTSSNPKTLGTDLFDNHLKFIGYTRPHSGIYLSKEFENNNLQFFQEDLSSLFSTQIVQIRNNIPCHTFHVSNSKLLNQNTIQSLVFGLRFNYGSYEIFNSSYTARSIFLYITNRNEIPKEQDIILSPGFNNVLQLTQNRYHYNGLRRQCRHNIFQVELYDALLENTKRFEGNYEDCQEIASQQLFVKHCNCYSPFLPIYKNLTGYPILCLNATYFTEKEVLKNAKCIVNVYRKFKTSSNFRKYYNNQCKIFKQHKCDVFSYKIEQRKDMLVELWSKISNRRREKLNKETYHHYFGKNDPKIDFHEIMRDNMIDLIIKRTHDFGDYFKEEREYPFSELLSDIGGLMGLWLGMSVVGLFEILEFFYLFSAYLCSIRRKDKSQITVKTFDYEVNNLS